MRIINKQNIQWMSIKNNRPDKTRDKLYKRKKLWEVYL